MSLGFHQYMNVHQYVNQQPQTQEPYESLPEDQTNDDSAPHLSCRITNWTFLVDLHP